MKDEYPTEGELREIVIWQSNWDALMEYVKPIWKYSEHGSGWCGWTQRGRTYQISTGGWSGNEDIIDAMQSNFIFWAMCWQSSRRGGHYIFTVPKLRKNKAESIS